MLWKISIYWNSADWSSKIRNVPIFPLLVVYQLYMCMYVATVLWTANSRCLGVGWSHTCIYMPAAVYMYSPPHKLSTASFGNTYNKAANSSGTFCLKLSVFGLYWIHMSVNFLLTFSKIRLIAIISAMTTQPDLL